MLSKINSIKKKFLFIFSLSFSILFIVLSIGSYYLNSKNFNEKETKYLKYVSDSIDSNLFHRLNNIKKKILIISEDDALTIYNKTKKDSVLDYFLLRFSDFVSIISFLDKNGDEVSRQENGDIIDSVDNMHLNPLYAKSFKNLNEVILSNINYNANLETYTIEFILQKTTYFNEKFIGMVFGILSVDILFKDLLPIDKELSIRIVDNNGIITFSSIPKELSKKINLSKIEKNKLEQVSILNEESVTYSRYILDGSSTLLVSKSLNTFMSGIKSFIFSQLMIFATIFFVVIIFIYFYTKRNISNPIETLIESTTIISKGNLSHKININTNDEIEVLGNSFNKMSEKLQVSLFDLKQKEKDLQSVNQELLKLNIDLEDRIEKQIQDIRKKDNVIIENARMSSIAELMQNIAHQWRQPLNEISLLLQNLEFSQMTGNIDEKLLVSTSERGKEITKDLSRTIDKFGSFFNTNRGKELFLIKEAILSSLDIIRLDIEKNNISIKMDFNTKTKLFISKESFSQVILHLITNARDAFVSSNIKKDKQIFISTYEDEKNIIIEVSDNAGGIEEKYLSKIFDPYFTTKFKSKGTGIGLYMSYITIVEHLNGTIEVSNYITLVNKKENKGTKFTIKLPK